MKIHSITFLLLIVGGLNWLLLGVFGWEIGEIFGGSGAIVSRAIYILVGLSAVYEIIAHKKICKMCEKSGPNMQPSGMQKPGM